MFGVCAAGMVMTRDKVEQAESSIDLAGMIV